jgi:predicted nucleic acid-binding protein
VPKPACVPGKAFLDTSIQVLNEFASVASRKLRMSIPQIRECLEPIAQICRIEPLTLQTHARVLEVAARYGFSVVDSTAIRSPPINNCHGIPPM